MHRYKRFRVLGTGLIALFGVQGARGFRVLAVSNWDAKVFRRGRGEDEAEWVRTEKLGTLALIT